MDEKNVDKRNAKSQKMAPWVGIGLALGAGLGVVFDNIAIGIGIGLALGAAIGAAQARQSDDEM